MVLKIKNVGLIESADIELNGITVIAGHNNSGKSTVSKSLYCIASSFCDTFKQIRKYRIDAITRRSSFEIAEFLVDNREKYGNDKALLSEYLAANQDSLVFKYRKVREENDEDFKARIDDLSRYILNTLSISDADLMAGIFAKKLETEFDMQVHNVYESSDFSELRLQASTHEVFARIEQNEVSEMSGIVDITNSIIYIDDVNVLDKLDWYASRRGYYNKLSY